MQRVLIIADLEGASGRLTEKMLDDLSAVVNLSKDLNAIIDGISKKTKQIYLWDFHGDEHNIPEGMIDFRAKILRHPSFEQIMKLKFDKVFLVGFHSMAGKRNEFRPHTYSEEDVKYFRLNGKPVGEATLFAYLFSEIKVPIVFISASEASVQELKKLGLDFKAVVTRKGKRSTKLTKRDFSSAAYSAMQLEGKLVKQPEYHFKIAMYSPATVKQFVRTGLFRKRPNKVVVAKTKKFSKIYRTFVNLLFRVWRQKYTL